MKIIDTTLHIKRHILDVFSGDVSGTVQMIFLISACFADIIQKLNDKIISLLSNKKQPPEHTPQKRIPVTIFQTK